MLPTIGTLLRFSLQNVRSPDYRAKVFFVPYYGIAGSSRTSTGRFWITHDFGQSSSLPFCTTSIPGAESLVDIDVSSDGSFEGLTFSFDDDEPMEDASLMPTEDNHYCPDTCRSTGGILNYIRNIGHTTLMQHLYRDAFSSVGPQGFVSVR
jgi:hypothetical protein